MSFQERIDKFNHMIADARRIVFFTGAGISTGSGIPDFRSADGLHIPYDAIDDFLLDGIILEMAIWEKMQAAHKRNEHKGVIQLPAPRRDGYPLNRMNRHGGIYEVF